MSQPGIHTQLRFVAATAADAGRLAEMNRRLIVDEGHRNPMSLSDLEQRMSGWLPGEYSATLFELDATTVGYALYRDEPDHVYLRQFFVERDYRRQGIGRAAIRWLSESIWSGRRIRLDVLVKNDPGLAFWRAVGFEDYCLTLEMESD